MLLEVVTVVSSSSEAAMLREHLIDRRSDLNVTVLTRPGVAPPTRDGSVRTVPIGAGGMVETALQEYAGQAQGRWLLQVDPDERWPDEAFHRSQTLVDVLDETEAAAFPMVYFVGQRPLRGGPWSGNYYQRLHSASLLARGPADVHLRPAASRVERVALAEPVQHFWIRDLTELRAKHDRYLEREGRARTVRFGPYRPNTAAAQLIRTVGRCVLSVPWKDGVLGMCLAAEMVRYQWKANAAWRRDRRCSGGS